MSETGPSFDPTRDTEQTVDLPDLSSLRPGEGCEFVYRGVPLHLSLSQESVCYEDIMDQSMSDRVYCVSLRGQTILEMSFHFYRSLGELPGFGALDLEHPFVQTVIEKRAQKEVDEETQIVLRGLGKQMYRQLLQELQSLANTIDQSFEHEVRHIASYGMTAQQWNRVFEPILHQAAYTQKRAGLWYKTYSPQ